MYVYVGDDRDDAAGAGGEQEVAEVRHDLRRPAGPSNSNSNNTYYLYTIVIQ